MLRKRSRQVHKDQSKGHLMPDSAPDSSFSSDASVHRNKNTSFFSVPGLLVGFGSSALSDSDSARSPTSPLDFKGFSNPISCLRSPRPSSNRPKKIWDCNRVGLGILDFLNHETQPCGEFLSFSDSPNILLSPHTRTNIPVYGNKPQSLASLAVSPRSLPKDYTVNPETRMKSPLVSSNSLEMALESNENHLAPEVLQKLQSCSSNSFRSPSSLTRLVYCKPNSSFDKKSLDMKRAQLGSSQFVKGDSNFDSNFDNFSVTPTLLHVSIGSSNILMGSLSASEIELSEDYTRVISHGPNAKTTHIFGDCILESHKGELDNHNKKGWEIGTPYLANSWDDLLHPAIDFLSFCYSCKKKLEEDKDIYMYRGEKAFCSCTCRSQAILVEDEVEKSNVDPLHSTKLSEREEIFLVGMIDA